MSLQWEKKKQDGGTFTVLTLRFRKTRKLQGDSVGLICTPTLLISLVETLTGKRGRHLSACTCTRARRKTLEKHKEELLLTLRDQLNRAWKHGGLKHRPFGNRTICFQAFCLLGSRLDCFNIKNISSKSITTVEINVCESIPFAQRLRPWFVAWQSNPQCPNTWGGIYKGAEKSMSGNRVDQHKGSDYGMSRGNPRLVGEVKMVGGGGIGGGG